MDDPLDFHRSPLVVQFQLHERGVSVPREVLLLVTLMQPGGPDTRSLQLAVWDASRRTGYATPAEAPVTNASKPEGLELAYDEDFIAMVRMTALLCAVDPFVAHPSRSDIVTEREQRAASGLTMRLDAAPDGSFLRLKLSYPETTILKADLHAVPEPAALLAELVAAQFALAKGFAKRADKLEHFVSRQDEAVQEVQAQNARLLKAQGEAEAALIAKAVVILNEKKAIIRDLRSHVKQLEEERYEIQQRQARGAIAAVEAEGKAPMAPEAEAEATKPKSKGRGGGRGGGSKAAAAKPHGGAKAASSRGRKASRSRSSSPEASDASAGGRKRAAAAAPKRKGPATRSSTQARVLSDDTESEGGDEQSGAALIGAGVIASLAPGDLGMGDEADLYAGPGAADDSNGIGAFNYFPHSGGASSGRRRGAMIDEGEEDDDDDEDGGGSSDASSSRSSVASLRVGDRTHRLPFDTSGAHVPPVHPPAAVIQRMPRLGDFLKGVEGKPQQPVAAAAAPPAAGHGAAASSSSGSGGAPPSAPKAPAPAALPRLPPLPAAPPPPPTDAEAVVDDLFGGRF